MNNNEVFDDITFTINTALSLSTFSTEKRRKIKGLNYEFRVEIKCERMSEVCREFQLLAFDDLFFGIWFNMEIGELRLWRNLCGSYFES